ncbi:hypothetical protein [Pontiella sulfatireligans]|uniref:Uncharacterized protein n=1 Tax=Pontiella sulfatireligans TaxID=2750658 RepID=A0A6C2ULD1_9BACT|nr:hypothetical protein [Pontiella sulfatireligans]VGO20227.1 hypothetical protein SCARR_02288 [Pontiella sulfatireligans]
MRAELIQQAEAWNDLVINSFVNFYAEHLRLTSRGDCLFAFSAAAFRHLDRELLRRTPGGKF